MEDRKTILLIDDEPEILYIIETKLKNQGYEVHTTVDGEEGLTLAQTLLPDVIVLDVNMPEMDGGEVGAHLRGDPKTRAIPIIFLTALISPGEGTETCHCVGNNIVLSKSCDIKELIKLVERLTTPVPQEQS